MRDPKQHQKYLAELFDLYAKGRIKPQVTASFELADAGKALEYIANRKALGKVVLTVD